MYSSFLQTDIVALKRILASSCPELESSFEQALDALSFCLTAGNKILAFGNGGSAADAEHLAAELVGRFGYDRNPLPAIALTQASPAITAIGNDYGYDCIFERQVRALGRPGDIALGISTSGNSPNVLIGLKAARDAGLMTIALTGRRESPIRETAGICLQAPSTETPRIQEIHGLLIHSLCRGIEARMFPRELPVLPPEKLVPPTDLKRFAAAIAPHRSVFTNGCFDILHPGHVALLQQARNLGDLLLVGLNADESVRKLKGPKRPIHDFAGRAQVLAALSVVDYIIGFAEETPRKLIECLSPKVLVKGGDYSRETIVGADWVEAHGGEVIVIPLIEGHSTTGILKHAGK